MPTCSRQKKLGNITLRHFQNNGKKMPPEVLLISPINIKGTFNQQVRDKPIRKGENEVVSASKRCTDQRAEEDSTC